MIPTNHNAWLASLVLTLLLVSCGGDDASSNASADSALESGAPNAGQAAQARSPVNSQPNFPTSLDENEYDRLIDELDSLPDRVIPRVEDDAKLRFASTAAAEERIVELIEAGNQPEADKVYASVDANTRNDLTRAIIKAQTAARREARDSDDYAIPYRFERFLKIDYGSLWQLDAEYIQGRVTDADTGAPVSGAELRMHPPYATSATTDSDGRYSLLMPATGAGVDVNHPNYEYKFVYQTESGVSLKPAELQGQPVDIQLAASNAVPRPDLPSLTLRGRIVDAATGEPVAGLPVSVAFDPIAGAPEFGLKTMAGDYIRETDAGGRFAVTDLPVDNVHMLVQGVVDKKLYVLKQDKFVFEDSVELDFEVEGRELSLQAPLIVVGTVRDRRTGLPINGARVSAGGWKAERTGKRGQFLIQLDPGKSWQLVASHDAYHTSSPKPFSSAVPTKIETEFLLDPITTGTILGTAINAATGEPIVNAVIEIAGQKVRTDSQGRFRAEEIESGEVQVSGAQSGFRADSQKLLLEALQTAEATLELEPITTGTIRGIVVDLESGAPLAGVSVSAGDVSGVTGDDGRFILEEVEAGAVSVGASKALFVPASTDVNLEAMASAEARLALEPITWGTVQGDVRDATTGQPLANASVRIGAIEVKTDADGSFVAERVPAGDLSVVAGLARYHDAQATAELVRDGNATLMLELAPITTGTVVATIFDATSGKPISGADVMIGQRRKSTNTSGQATAEEIPAGQVVINASARLYEPGSAEIGLDAAAESRVEIKLVPVTYGTIAGTVTDSVSGAPLANAKVRFAGLDRRSNAEGAFRAERVPAGSVSVSAELFRYRGDQETVTLAPGTTQEVNLALEPITTGTVQGIVRNAADSKPVAGATVTIGNLSARSNADGRFEIKQVPAGKVIARANLKLFEPGESPVNVEVAAVIDTEISVTPITYGTVSGTVVNADTGQPLENAAVRAGRQSTRTNAAGEFELQRVAAGNISVLASKAVHIDDSTTIALAAGASETVTLRLQPITWGVVTGIVTDAETGQPLANAEVVVGTQKARSDNAGRFRAEKVPAGALRVAGTLPAYEPGSVTTQLQADAERDVKLALVPIRIGDISGTVVDAKTGEPIAQARVTTGRLAAETDSAGRFNFKSVATGSNAVAAQHPDYAKGSAIAVVPPAGVVDVTIKLDLRREDVTNLEAELAKSGTIDLYGIYFDSGRDQFKPSSLPTLRAVLEVMKRAPERRFQIAGHTDSDGSDSLNQDLSERRAGTVIRWLVDNGIDANRIDGIGYGEARPAAPNDTESGKALNRRVQLSFAD
ncbi:MAG TPA: carboxypeptidase regulatory-like domain-containing protein [Woeseiaceae bacterium]|nr:carboxypeptidase regulatory-like domain-containing protein [Woeseiaceae bacterium]